MSDFDPVEEAGKSFFDRARKAVVAAALGIPAGIAAGVATGEPLTGAIFGAFAAAINSVAVYYTQNK